MSSWFSSFLSNIASCHMIKKWLRMDKFTLQWRGEGEGANRTLKIVYLPPEPLLLLFKKKKL